MDRPDYAVYLGLDVGKEEHHATGLDPAGQRVHDKPLPQAEDKIRDLLQALTERGRVLVVVDQSASIGALAVAVARDLGIDVAYLPGLAVRRIADLHPGNAKTDARDASSPRQPGRCRTRCAESTPAMRPWPTWKSSSATTTTWPVRSLGSATASVAC